MEIKYVFVGDARNRSGRFDMTVFGQIAVPRKDEIVIFISSDGDENEYQVKGVHHVYEDNKISVQVILR